MRILDETYFWGNLSLPIAEVGKPVSSLDDSSTGKLMVTSAEKLLSELIDCYEFEALVYLFGNKFAESFANEFPVLSEYVGTIFDDVKGIIYRKSLMSKLPISSVANYVFLMIDNFTKTKRMQKAVVQNLIVNTSPADNKLQTSRIMNEMIDLTIATINDLIVYFNENGINIKDGTVISSGYSFDYSAEYFSDVIFIREAAVFNNYHGLFEKKKYVNPLFL